MSATSKTGDEHLDELPERDFAWGTEAVEASGATLIGNAGRARFSASDRATYLGSKTIGYFVDGVDAYLDEHADRELSIPSTYSSMDDFAGYIGSVSARGHDFGMGLDPGRLEAGIRVATGGGRYSTDDITVIACGEVGAVFRAPEGDFLVSSAGVPAFEADKAHAYPTHDVAGMDAPEKRETYRDGIRELADLPPEVEGVELVAHEKVSGPKHYFKTADGETLRISGQDLATLAGTKRDPEAILGTVTWDREHHPDTYEAEVTEDDLEYEIGDDFLGEVIGYKLIWKTDSHGRYSQKSGIRRVRLQVSYVRYTFDGRLSISMSTRDIQKWEV